MTIQANSIIHGDCVKVLADLPAGCAQFILTDPPYFVSYQSRDGRKVPNDDNDAWLQPAFAGLYRALARDSYCFSFYGWPYADKFLIAFRKAGFRVVGHVLFPKRYTSTTRIFKYQHECGYLLAKGNPRLPDQPIGDVMEWSYSGNRLHPTQKPISALLPLVKTFSRPEGLILDPFAGSGSSLVAAKTLGRRWLGIELDATYHAIASKRLQEGEEQAPSFAAGQKVQNFIPAAA